MVKDEYLIRKIFDLFRLPIVEVLGMLPGEAAGLVKMVMKTCNDNPVTDNA